MTSFDFRHNEGFVMHSSLKTMRVMAWTGLDLGQNDFLEDYKKTKTLSEKIWWEGSVFPPEAVLLSLSNPYSQLLGR